MQNVLIFIQVNDDKIHTRMQVAGKLFIHICLQHLCIAQQYFGMKYFP